MTLTNREVFAIDPTSYDIPNLGVAKVKNPENDGDWATLEWELRSFVCEGEYERGLERILDQFLTHLGQAEQPAVWVSGFYGSGKSHLMRVLEYLWRDFQLPSGAPARSLGTLPSDIEKHLKELSIAAKRAGGLWSAAGTLGSGASGSVRLAFLGTVFGAAGLPPQIGPARLALWLHREDLYDRVAEAIKGRGRDPSYELRNLYVSPVLSQALIDAGASFGSTPGEVSSALQAQYPMVDDIDRDQMLNIMEDVLRSQGTKGKLPLTLIVLDEMQQFINDDNKIAEQVQYIAEDCASRFGSQLVLVATGQSALTATPTLQKLNDRFSVTVALSDTDVETVVRKVVLRKKVDKVADIEVALGKVSGEIARHLGGTRLEAKGADKATIVADYPLLPTRRRFWERALRAIDKAGKAGVLRTQLKIVHEAARGIADKPLGTVIGGDFVFRSESASMLQSGVLLKEIDELIRSLDDGSEDGQLKSRAAALVFLISQLPHDGVGDTGVRATAPILADLLVEDLAGDGPRLRKDVPRIMEELVEHGRVMKLGEEFHLQTAEGAEWTQEFNQRRISIRADAARMSSLRNDWLRRVVDNELAGVKLVHGKSKSPRKLARHWGDDAPTTDGGTIPIWIRDEWGMTEAKIRDTAASAGNDSPIVFVLLPKIDAEAIADALASYSAATDTVSQRPEPQTDEGRQAKRGMQSRVLEGQQRLESMFAAVISNARVFQGGGNELTTSSLRDGVEVAGNHALARLFPKFNAADDPAWSKVISKTRDGDPDALAAVGWQGEVPANPVCKEVLARTSGSGTKGSELQRDLGNAPFGWPKDAIDGALLALLTSGNIRAERDGHPVDGPKELPATQISKATFFKEDPPPTKQEQLAVRGVLTEAKVPYTPGKEGAAISGLLQYLLDLAARSGGPPPLPEPPNTSHLGGIAAFAGNQQVRAVAQHAEQLRQDVKSWSAAAEQRADREQAWRTLDRLLVHATGLDLTPSISVQRDAIEADRLLMHSPDPVAPLVKELSEALRVAVVDAAKSAKDDQEKALTEIEASAEWKQLTSGDRGPDSGISGTVRNHGSGGRLRRGAPQGARRHAPERVVRAPPGDPGQGRRSPSSGGQEVRTQVRHRHCTGRDPANRNRGRHLLGRVASAATPPCCQWRDHHHLRIRAMPVLNSQQRKILEDACTQGRRASEQAVRAALTSLAVTAERPPGHLSEDDRQLRRGLRAKARQLGDTGDDVELLVAECAYEQWHRLLFARFLAENDLLIHPEYRAPVTLEDCEDLAGSLGEPDGWSVAARFAAEILPGIFRLDDPCVCLRLAPEGRLALEGILASLPSEVFAGDDGLGWVYQFWQKDKKDEINAADRKIGRADLGPVTQLFTENYMVRFLLENSLGAWWAHRHPDSPLVKSFKYLRFNDEGEPAAGTFDGWPYAASEVTVMDPCCGSGHFLTEAFSMLWQMRAEEEGFSAKDAQDVVLRDNLFGLELDPRCVQIAMFAVVLHAWKTGEGWRELPVPNIACSGLPVKAPVSEWKALALGDERMERALIRLHILFRDAETLGSLIDPHRSAEISDPTGLQGSFDDVEWKEVAPLLAAAAGQEKADPATTVLGAEVEGLARAATFLAGKYTLISTNVPYLTRNSHSSALADFAARHYPAAKHDLATVFLERAQGLTTNGGAVFVVIAQNWLFMPRYELLRRHLLARATWAVLARLGEGAFQSTQAAGAFVCLLGLESRRPGPFETMMALDASTGGSAAACEHLLESAPISLLAQNSQLANPDARVLISEGIAGELLAHYAESRYGLRTGDSNRFIRCFWELPQIDERWRFHQGTPDGSAAYSGRESLLLWAREGGLHEYAEAGIASLQGGDAWGRRGVVVKLTRDLTAALYTGESFDNNVAVVWPLDSADLPAVWAFLRAPEFTAAVRQIDQSLKVMNATLLKVPFDVDHWRGVANAEGPLPDPSSDDPTQWLFEGRPEASTDPLQVAVCRLVGYRWPEQPESDDLEGFADGDGIVCLPSVAGEPPAADRLQQVLAVAFGQSWSPAKQEVLLEGTGSKKKNLGDWLRDDFFRQHCALFGHRPFIWHIWDGQRDGFAALVNYHRLDRKTLEKLTYSYLGDWIERQRAEVRDEKTGAEARLAAASKLRSSLELILDGEPPYDIYVRWKALAEQPIGWEPDVNDGVRLNVRPFVEAGVLRSSFSIHWRKDRGRNSDGSERLNDIHCTTAAKRAARSGSA